MDSRSRLLGQGLRAGMPPRMRQGGHRGERRRGGRTAETVDGAGIFTTIAESACEKACEAIEAAIEDAGLPDRNEE